MTADNDLLGRLREFTAFARKRLGDPDLADEAVQASLLKALTHGDQLASPESLVAWYYRILRRTIADIVSQQRRNSSVERPLADTDGTAAVDYGEACACVGRLLDDLPPPYARALRAVEYDGASLEQVARQEGISLTNVKQRRLRAKERLRGLLLATCKACATHGCLDCTCTKPGHDPS